MNTLEQTLLQLGLGVKETKIYLAMLKLGEAHVSAIAKESGINRSTAYITLAELERKGLASRTTSKKMHFSGLHPQKLLALEKAKMSSLEFILPSLLGLANKAEQKPAVRFFTGTSGIRAVYEESLLLASGAEILALGHAQAVETKIPKFREWYIQRRVKLGIRMRAITPATPGGLAVAGRDKLELRQTRVLAPHTFTEQVEINIYKNIVSMVSLVDKELIGMITESSVFANAHKQIFELLWAGAKSLKK
jgi:predicted DNA-binding transcriptional regulator